ncbi:MAG TPA: DUF169 domain-containing protein [Bryobacteraceae bacterium]|nr:DUF169 domain-containing protein [Bryobacteraceae bacterium]
MSDYRAIEEKLQGMLGSARRPIAVTFLETPPEGVAKFAGEMPSSCSFWRLASGGSTFYTVPSDHLNCPVGGYTHNALPAERMPELQQVLTLMSDIGYIRMEEIPGVFHLSTPPQVVLYAPLGETPAPPSVVLASGRPARVMMLSEAANRAGASSNLPLLGRPTCMAIPASLSNGAVLSSGCIGNRVYTGIGDDELYVVLRGSDLDRIAAEIPTIQSANQTLTGYHEDRRARLTVLSS